MLLMPQHQKNRKDRFLAQSGNYCSSKKSNSKPPAIFCLMVIRSRLCGFVLLYLILLGRAVGIRTLVFSLLLGIATLEWESLLLKARASMG